MLWQRCSQFLVHSFSRATHSEDSFICVSQRWQTLLSLSPSYHHHAKRGHRKWYHPFTCIMLPLNYADRRGMPLSQHHYIDTWKMCKDHIFCPRLAPSEWVIGATTFRLQNHPRNLLYISVLLSLSSSHFSCILQAGRKLTYPNKLAFQKQSHFPPKCIINQTYRGEGRREF